MRVLIVNDNAGERAAMARALQPAIRQVDCAAEAKAALAMVGREPVHVVLLAWPPAGGADVLRRLLAPAPVANAYVLLLVDAMLPAREIGVALAAGAHDFLRRPVFPDDLLLRVQAPDRILRWARGVPATDSGNVAPPDVQKLRGFTEMGAVVAHDLAEMLGVPLEPEEGWPKAFGRGLVGATVPLSLPHERTELRVSVVANRPALAKLVTLLLGVAKADAAAEEDLLREMVNQAGGSVKRAAMAEGVTFTTGIPVHNAGLRPTGDAREWTVRVGGPDEVIAVVGEIRRRDNLRLPATQLREGMIVVQDVRNEGGVVIVAAGTRLTSTTADRLAQVLGRRYVVEVAPAA